MPEGQEYTYDENLMARSLLPVLEDPSAIAYPKDTIKKMQSIYDAGEGRWDNDAKALFEEHVSRLRKVAGVEYDLSPVDSYTPPDPDPKKTEQENLLAVDKWKEDTLAELDKDGGSIWHTVKDQGEKILDNKARAVKQRITGSETGQIWDKIDRGLNATLGTAASAMPGVSDATVADMASYFDTNPKYNDTRFARYAEAIGQGGAQMAIPAAAGLLTGAVATPAAGLAVWAGLGAMINGRLAFKETYNNIYESTGDPALAWQIGLERAGGEGLLEVAGDSLIGAKVLGPWFHGLSEAKKIKVAGEVLNKTTVPIRKKILGIAGDAAVATGTEYATEASQSLSQQSFEEPYTQKRVSLEQAALEGEMGAVAGFVFGGGASTITHVFSPNYNPKKIADALVREAEKGNKISDDGQSFESENTSDFQKPVNSALFDLDEAQKTEQETKEKEAQAATAAIETGLGTEAQNEKVAEQEKQQKEDDKNAAPLTESAQPELAQKLETFAEDTNASKVTIPGVKASEVSPSLLTAASVGTDSKLKVEDSPLGAVVTKKQILPEDIKVATERIESEREITPNAEEEARIALYPNKISQLLNKLSRMDTKETLISKMRDLAKLIAQKKEALKYARQLSNRGEKDLSKNRLQKEIATFTKMLTEATENFYDYDALIAPQKLKLQKEVEQMQLKYDLARDYVGKPNQTLDTTAYSSPAELRDIIDTVEQSTPEQLDKKYKALEDEVAKAQSDWEAASKVKSADEKSSKDISKNKEGLSQRLDEAIQKKEKLKKVIDYLKTNSIQDARNALAMQEMFQEASKTQEKETASKGKKATPTAEQVKADPNQYIQESRSTGAAFTTGISNALRNTINYWLGGFGIRNVIVMTSDEFNSGAFNHLFNAPIRNLIKQIKENNALSGAGGVMHTNKEGTLGLMVLKDGSFEKDAFIKASHEVGHAVERMLLQNAPESIRNKVLKEFHDAVSSIEKSLNNKNNRLTVGMVADQMMGIRAESSPYSSDRLFKSIRKTPSQENPSAPYKDYIIGKDPSKTAGFAEFKANQVAKFLHDLRLNPGLRAEGLYGKLADVLNTLWKSVAERFRDAPTLKSWLDEHWSEQRANLMFYPGKKAVNTKGESNYAQVIREIKTNTRIENAPEGSSISARMKRFSRFVEYEQQHHEPILRKAFDTIHKLGVGPVIDSYLQEDGTIPTGERTLWAAQILDELERMDTHLKTAKDKKSIAAIENDIWERIVKDNLASGRIGEANKVLITHTLTGRAHHVTTELNEKAKSKGRVPPFEFEKVKEIISKYFETEKAAPDGIYRNTLVKAELEALNEAHNNIAKDFGWSWWYGSILSGISTQWANFQFTAFDVMGKTAASVMAHPGSTMHAFRGIGRGIVTGFKEALGAFQGKLLRNVEHTRIGKLIESNPRAEFKGTKVAPIVNKLFNWVLTAQKYFPFRTLAAVDMFWRRVGTELQVQMAAVEAIKANGAKLNSSQMASMVSSLLHNSDAEWASAEKQAVDDWATIKKTFEEDQKTKAAKAKELGIPFKPTAFPLIEPTKTDHYLRTMEIIDARRQASNDGVFQEGERAGVRTNLTIDPEGFEGALSSALKTFVGKVPQAKIVFPFINVTSNILYRILDYSPIGMARAVRGDLGTILSGNIKKLAKEGLHGRSLFNPRMREKVNPETGVVEGKEVHYWSPLESKQRLMEGLLGTAALGSFLLLSAKHKDDDDPVFAIYGRGPKEKGLKEQWLSEGNIPYSIKIGSYRYKFAETPAAFVFGVLGEFWDAYRWDKSFNRKTRPQQFAEAMSMGIQVAGEMGVLKAVKDVSDSIFGDRSKLGTAVSSVKGLIPYSGLMRDVAKFTDEAKVDPTSAKAVFWSGIPWAQGAWGGKNDLNGFGEAIQKSGRFWSTSNVDKAWKFLAANDLRLPGIAPTIMIGKGSGDEKAFYSAVLNERKAYLGRVAYDVLTPEESYTLQLEAGKNIKKRILGIVREGTIKNKEVYQEAINKIVEEERRKAKVKVLINTHKQIKSGLQ